MAKLFQWHSAFGPDKNMNIANGRPKSALERSAISHPPDPRPCTATPDRGKNTDAVNI